MPSQLLDFEKAFDSLSYQLLKMQTLYGYGISDKTLVWNDSFLCNRQQRVLVNLFCLVCCRALFLVACCFTCT